MFPNFCDGNCAVCEKIWKNQTGHRRQYKTRHAQCMLFNKATDKHPEYVIPICCFFIVPYIFNNVGVLLPTNALFIRHIKC